jgi:hypothetical protein
MSNTSKEVNLQSNVKKLSNKQYKQLKIAKALAKKQENDEHQINRAIQKNNASIYIRLLADLRLEQEMLFSELSNLQTISDKSIIISNLELKTFHDQFIIHHNKIGSESTNAYNQFCNPYIPRENIDEFLPILKNSNLIARTFNSINEKNNILISQHVIIKPPTKIHRSDSTSRIRPKSRLEPEDIDHDQIYSEKQNEIYKRRQYITNKIRRRLTADHTESNSVAESNATDANSEKSKFDTMNKIKHS